MTQLRLTHPCIKMHNFLLIAIVAVNFCCLSSLEIPLVCDCESSNCYNKGILKERIVNFTSISCSFSEIKEVKLSWLTKGIEKSALLQFKNLKELKILNSFIESFEILHKNLHVINVPGNDIKNFLVKGENVQKFFAPKNKIEILPAKMFKNLRNLKNLNLEENQIFYVSETAFAVNLQLEVVNLNRNKLKFLEPKTFTSNSKLRQLHLNWNQIKNIQPELFAKNVNLEDLKLRGNQLTVIDRNSFTGNVHLNWLDLADNEIFLIQPKSFKNVNFVDLSLNYCVNEGFYVKSNKIKHMEQLIDRNCNIFFAISSGYF